MKRVTRFRYLTLVVGSALLVAGSGTPARAQADPGDVQRAVARISVMDGQVSVRRGDSGEWVAGVVNAPLMAGDSIATGSNSRAEVQFDASNILRVGGDSEIQMASLEYSRYQLQLARGTVTYRVLRQQTVDVEVDTPSISLKPSKQGSYRISVSSDGETQVVARGNSVEVFSPKGSEWVNPGQMLMARGPSSDPEFQTAGAPALDAWDSWSDGRDRLALNSTSYKNVPPGVYGTEDLDNYGNWVSTPDYGNVWQPTVSADWSPYGSGRWAWEDWYGWTWVSYDPWGWAPYHYGRWFQRAGYGWCWYPGGLGMRHYWSPALVGFFGWGGDGFGAGFGFGNVGWVPLAPYEMFHPWWGRSYYGRGGYFNQQMNLRNGNITNIYRNSNFANGVHGMRVSDFQSGRFGNNIGNYNGRQIGQVGAVQGRMPFAPGNENLRFSDRGVAGTPRANSANTRFFSRQPASAVERIPFAQQQRAFTQQGGPANRAQGGASGQAGQRAIDRPAASGSGRAMERNGQDNGARGNAPAGVQRNDRPGGGPGWQRFGTPGNAQQAAPGNAQQAAPRTQNTQQTPGWNRFGSPGQGASPNNSTPRSNSPQQQRDSAPTQRYNQQQDRPSSPSYSAPQQRSAPSYSAPQQRSAPSYSAPQQRSAPSYSAPQQRSAPSYSAPQQRSAPSNSAPRSSGGGGGGGGARSSGGGGNGGGRR